MAIPGGSRGCACAGGSGGNDGCGIRADAVYLYLRRGEPGYGQMRRGGLSAESSSHVLDKMSYLFYNGQKHNNFQFITMCHIKHSKLLEIYAFYSK